MSSLFSLLSGDLAAKLLAGLATIIVAVGGLFAVKRSGYNQGKAEAKSDQIKDVADATRVRNEVKDGVDAASDDAVRQRLRDKWTASR